MNRFLVAALAAFAASCGDLLMLYVIRLHAPRNFPRPGGSEPCTRVVLCVPRDVPSS